MRLIVVLDKFLPPTETFIKTQLEHLTKYCELYIIFIETKDYGEKIELSVNKIQLKKIKFQWAIRLSRSLVARYIFCPHINIIDMPYARKIIKEINPDAFLIHFGVTGCLYAKVLKHFAAPKFIYFHGHDASIILDNSKTYRGNLAKLFKNNYHPIFVSKSLEKKFKIYFPEENSEVIYLGLGQTFESEIRSIKKELIVFLQVARFVPMKGHAYLLEAFKLFRSLYPDINCELWLIGEGNTREEIETSCLKSGLGGSVKFCGQLTNNEVRDMMKRADVYVHHSITTLKGETEGLPISIMEAMACGLPIVSTIHAGIPEIIEQGINGYLSVEKDVYQFARNMFNAIQLDCFKTNKEKIENQFNSERQTKLLIKYIESFT